MTYYESAEGKTITLERVYQELEAHGITGEDAQLFFADMGNYYGNKYDAQAVLRWLGY